MLQVARVEEVAGHELRHLHLRQLAAGVEKVLDVPLVQQAQRLVGIEEHGGKLVVDIVGAAVGLCGVNESS